MSITDIVYDDLHLTFYDTSMLDEISYWKYWIIRLYNAGNNFNNIYKQS